MEKKRHFATKEEETYYRLQQMTAGLSGEERVGFLRGFISAMRPEQTITDQHQSDQLVVSMDDIATDLEATVGSEEFRQQLAERRAAGAAHSWLEQYIPQIMEDSIQRRTQAPFMPAYEEG